MTKRPFFYRITVKPKHDPDHQFPHFEKPRQCKFTLKLRIEALEEWLLSKYAKRDKEKAEEVRALLKRLLSCEREAECGSPACPKCRRQYRRWYASEYLKLADGQEILFLTYIPQSEPLEFEDVDDRYIRKITARLLKRFERKLPESARAFGSVDLKVLWEGEVEPHFHVLVFGCTADELRALKVDKRKRKRRRKGDDGPKKKRGKGAPWVVDNVMPEDWMDIVTYSARQTGKGYEISSPQTYRALQRRKKTDKYFREEIWPRLRSVLVDQWLLANRMTWSQLRVQFRIEKRNGVRLRIAA